LVDEAWRGRVTRVSASRALLATERMLTSFPIQSLGDAPAMLEFSRFPASLATAAEIYENLESAVRAAPEPDRAALVRRQQPADGQTGHRFPTPTERAQNGVGVGS
jgi:hypothetical protein